MIYDNLYYTSHNYFKLLKNGDNLNLKSILENNFIHSLLLL